MVWLEVRPVIMRESAFIRIDSKDEDVKVAGLFSESCNFAFEITMDESGRLIDFVLFIMLRR